MITYGSLFSGIGGFDLAFRRAGMECPWQVEIDSKCQDILRRNLPGSEIYSDVRSVGKHNLKPVDLICGGFPCQDLSVAGRREGLAGERSGLWFEFHRIIAELRPEWVVIENVPGLLSSNGGADFAVILQGLVECGYGVCWRVLDAQYFGVAQRRRRVFIVGHLGDGRAAEVLFEREGGTGDTAPSREAGQGTTRSVETISFIPGNSAQSRGIGATENISVTIKGDGGGTKPHVAITGAVSSKWAKGTGGPAGDEAYNLVVAHETGKGFWTEGLPGLRGQPGGMPENIIAWHGAQITSPKNKGGVFEGITPTINQDARSMIGVRRLTPLECERLQGFPDNWTAGQSDSTRYRQLGNAVAVPVVEWIRKQLLNVLETT
jgi:DNA (cytosine-5)-methyltransferase 1